MGTDAPAPSAIRSDARPDTTRDDPRCGTAPPATPQRTLSPAPAASPHTPPPHPRSQTQRAAPPRWAMAASRSPARPGHDGIEPLADHEPGVDLVDPPANLGNLGVG